MEDALRELGQEAKEIWPSWVLILVLMEDALREFRGFFDNRPLDVLILVLMEDALRARYVCSALASNLVLILVLMEDALRAH